MSQTSQTKKKINFFPNENEVFHFGNYGFRVKKDEVYISLLPMKSWHSDTYAKAVADFTLDYEAAASCKTAAIPASELKFFLVMPKRNE